VDSVNQLVNTKLGSLDSLNVTPKLYNNFVDSIYRSFDSYLAGVNTNNIDSAGKREVENIRSEIKRRTSFLDSLRAAGAFESVSLKSRFGDGLINSPSFPKIESSHLPFGESGIIKSTLPLTDIKGKLSPTDLPNVPSFNGVGNQVRNLNTAELNTQTLGDVAEKAAMNTKELESVQEAISPAEKMQTQATELVETLNKPDQLPELGKRRVAKLMPANISPDQPDLLQPALKYLGKYQRKYHSLADTRYLPKHRTNPEQGKPFLQRTSFGINFQLQKMPGKWTGMEQASYVTYHFSDRLKGSLAGIYFLNATLHPLELRSARHPIAVRTWVQYKIIKNSFFHLEWQSRKRQKVSGAGSSTNTESTTFADHVSFGVFQSFHLSKRFHWNVLYLLSLQQLREFTFASSDFRLGIEYRIVKGEKK